MILSPRYKTQDRVASTYKNTVFQYYAGLKPSIILTWICISVLTLYPISLIMYLRGLLDLNENILNRILILLLAGFALLRAKDLITYYLGNLVIADWLFFLFTCFYFYGLNELDLQAYSRYGRLALFFYVVPFYLRYGVRLFNSAFDTLLLSILALIIIASYMHIGYMHSGVRLDLAGGYTSTARFYLCVFWICLITVTKSKMLFIKRTIFLSMMAASLVLTLLSGSRQALLGIILLTGIPYLISPKMKSFLSIKTITILFFVGATIVLTLTDVQRFETERTMRFFEEDINIGRIARYQYFLESIVQELPNSLIKGIKFFGDNKMQYSGVWIDLVAPHNVYLYYAVFCGVICSLMLFLFHLYCLGVMVYVYLKLSIWYPFRYIVAFVITVFLIAQFENFLYFVSSLESYLFYAGIGFLVNLLRDQKQLRISGKDSTKSGQG